MKIVVAPDKFKGSLSAKKAGDAMRAGLLRVWPDADIEVVPVADGGDGTMEAMLDAIGGRRIEREVHGPDGKQVLATMALVAGGSTAIVELAAASGLALMAAGENDPLTASTHGTGELIAAAIDSGARRIVLAIGGSATNDAGSGALTALGAHFLDENRRELAPGGCALLRLRHIEDLALKAKLQGVAIDIACDVDNPLVGPNGASAVYGPQKGASPDDVRALDAALTNFSDVVRARTGADVRDIPGAGAAGGVGGGFLALAGARLVPGAQLVLDVIKFSERLTDAALVVTGEGRLDRQTLAGKAPYAVARAAKKQNIPVVAVAGSINLRGDDLERLGIAAAEAVASDNVSVEEAMLRAYDLTADAAERLARRLAAAGTLRM